MWLHKYAHPQINGDVAVNDSFTYKTLEKIGHRRCAKSACSSNVFEILKKTKNKNISTKATTLRVSVILQFYYHFRAFIIMDTVLSRPAGICMTTYMSSSRY